MKYKVCIPLEATLQKKKFGDHCHRILIVCEFLFSCVCVYIYIWNWFNIFSFHLAVTSCLYGNYILCVCLFHAKRLYGGELHPTRRRAGVNNKRSGQR